MSFKQARFAPSFCLLLVIAFCLGTIKPTYAAELGKALAALSFDTKPYPFHFQPNGTVQVIVVYPAKPSSIENGKFNHRLQAKGICPLVITDIKHKAWYAPLAMVEKEINAQVKSPEHNPACPVSGDYEGLAVKHWGLEKRAVTIVVDGQGLVVFLAYGVLSPRQQGDIFLMLDAQQQHSPDNNLDQSSKSKPQA
jgi:hypothetical protein